MLQSVSPKAILNSINVALELLEQSPKAAEDYLRHMAQVCNKMINAGEVRHYRERFFVKTFKGEKIVDVCEVRYFVSENKTTYVKLIDDTSYEIDMPLGDVEQMVNPQQFMRVNRKYIVPLREIHGMDSYTNGRELLILKGKESPEIVISRDSKKKLHDWIG